VQLGRAADGVDACSAIAAAGADPPMPADRDQYITFAEGLQDQRS
jgi:hypothetical protein